MRTCHCPLCGGPPMILGALGNLLWMRCRDCGIDFNRKQRPRRKRVRKPEAEDGR